MERNPDGMMYSHFHVDGKSFHAREKEYSYYPYNVNRSHTRLPFLPLLYNICVSVVGTSCDKERQTATFCHPEEERCTLAVSCKPIFLFSTKNRL